jgi:hypothetical protein
MRRTRRSARPLLRYVTEACLFLADKPTSRRVNSGAIRTSLCYGWRQDFTYRRWNIGSATLRMMSLKAASQTTLAA